ncbi:hypothetical protein [Paludibacterium purpuratum]|uniref:Uncharacterized protein n=1 Tax=Paludibacterium purpuratum TaxID=1144873 RepID=A0A4R7B9Y0_9NEIS|nr:hypothetical protein [Paludibacterium purpuratum]TDR80645.1 hypothetical protein DFP86_104144 [Paludibacterium purpuratum]
MTNKKPTTPTKAARQDESKRWQRTENACRTLMDTLFQWQREQGEILAERTQQYLSMTAIHYRKIRHGKVISAGDFNQCVEVCQCALRALQAQDPSLAFTDDKLGEALRQAWQLADGVLADYRKLKSGG